jgi:hypothetical protein
MTLAIFDLTPETFTPHALHNHDQNFRETNCYSDLIIEIAQALGVNPIACLGYTLAADFEDDQWTFGKPSHHDLQTMYGMRVEELALYRALESQIVTQVRKGVISLVEVDSYHLPDTAGIDYRTGHVKTTIGISAIDPEHKTMHYFHNASFSRLEGEDYDGILTPLIANQTGYLPPYCEIIKLDQVRILPEETLRTIAFESARLHFSKRTGLNPITAHAKAMKAHQENIIAGGLPAYHAYTFVALRQLGASHQLGAHFLRWLDDQNPSFIEAANAFDVISTTAKTLVLKLARVANSGKLADLSAAFDEMAAQWQQAHTLLEKALK